MFISDFSEQLQKTKEQMPTWVSALLHNQRLCCPLLDFQWLVD
jgi:hypothetical protein